MNIELPNISIIIEKLIDINAKFNDQTKPIHEWIDEHRQYIKDNNELVQNQSKQNDIKILTIMLRDLLVRAMRGEMGMKTYYELEAGIKDKDDLNADNYERILERANYRWGPEKGAEIIDAVVRIFKDKLNWDWESYLGDAERNYEANFQQDLLLQIKGIGFKVRDLALSNFNINYVANDLHVVRVVTRTGLLNYGFDLLKDNNLEIGNNPGDSKNYLFLHKLVLKLSDFTGREYSPVDFDRIFWFLGRTFCGAKSKCNTCPIRHSCLTGRERVN